MRKGLKETAICVIILTVLASFAGCMDWDRDDEGVINAAKVYAESVVKLRTGKTVSSIYEPEDDLKSRLNDLLAGEGYEESYHDICEAIASTLEYEINEDSVESSVKKSEGSVIVSFSVVDSDAVYDMVNEEGGKFDDFIDALTSEDAPVTEYTMTLDLIFKDGKWLVMDQTGKKVFQVYSFYRVAMNYEFTPDYADLIDYIEWWYSDNGEYSNVNQIELDIIPTTGEGSEIEWDFYYEYYYNGELIYTSDNCVDQGRWIESYYGPYFDDNAPMNGENHASGEYRCVVYDLDGNVLADETCTVHSLDYDVYRLSDLVDYTEWWYSDQGVYTDEDTIELDIIPKPGVGTEITWDFYYEYYYNGELIYTSDICTDRGSWIESYYGVWYDSDARLNDNGYLIDGEYTCIVYDQNGNVIAESSCEIVNS